MKLLILLCLSSAVSCTSPCGIRQTREVSSRWKRLILGGQKVTTPRKWPWQVYLRNVRNLNESDYCGGTIIAEQWVLTAAHCVADANRTSDVEAYAGITQFDEDEDDPSSRTYSSDFGGLLPAVAEVFIHPDYIDYNISDIALIKLESPINYDKNVAPICLPSPSQSIPNYGRAVIVGFGRSRGEGANGTVAGGQLQDAVVPIIPPEVCEERWTVPGEHTLEEWRSLNVVCASKKWRGTHRGDSGGPLMMIDADGRWFQLGIASFMGKYNDGVDGEKFPKAFTDVRKYCDWIKEASDGEASCQEDEVNLYHSTNYYRG